MFLACHDVELDVGAEKRARVSHDLGWMQPKQKTNLSRCVVAE